MLKTKCDSSNKLHLMSCNKCLDNWLSLSPIRYLPLRIKQQQKTFKESCISSALEIIFFLKYLKGSILSYQKSVFTENLAHMYLNIDSSIEAQDRIVRCLEIIIKEYDYVIIEDMFDALNVIFHEIHHLSCKSLCPVHNNIVIVDLIETNCSCEHHKSYDIGNNCYYMICFITNPSQSFINQLKSQEASELCKKCDSTLNKSSKVTKFSKYFLVKFILETSSTLTYSAIIPDSIDLTDIFSSKDSDPTDSHKPYTLSMILVKIASEFKYFLRLEDKFYDHTGNFYSKSQVFLFIQSKNISIIGVIYEHIPDNPDFFTTLPAFQPKKVTEALCACGAACSIGESSCASCLSMSPTKPSLPKPEEHKRVSPRKKADVQKHEILIKSITNSCNHCQRPIGTCNKKCKNFSN